MQLITFAQRQKLLENGRAQRAAIDRQDQALDFEPVVKLFTPDGNATWLLTESTSTSIWPSVFATSGSGSLNSAM
jgi:hypothetical protein